MPWKEQSIVDHRYQFVLDLLQGVSMSEACRMHGIDRKTGYKWKARFVESGRSGLVDRPRIAHHRRHALDPAVAELVVQLRRERPTWGPKKLLSYLQRRHPHVKLPARSTVAELLSRRGLTEPRRKRQRVAAYESALGGYFGPNAVWCADFKGPMRLRRGSSAPLTISDGTSRYCLCCEHLPVQRTAEVKRAFARAFRHYGLPDAIRTDNGPPFASVGLAGLGNLSVWWIKLGIVPERIEPGCPTQNGRHERLHRTLQQELAGLLAKTSRPQPLYAPFRRDHNYERPHEALNLQTPAEVYRPSTRHYPVRLNDPSYPKGYVMERLGDRGQLFWRGKTFYLSKVLQGELVGIDIENSDSPQLYFGPIPLGHIANHRFWPRKRKSRNLKKKKKTPNL